VEPYNAVMDRMGRKDVKQSSKKGKKNTKKEEALTGDLPLRTSPSVLDQDDEQLNSISIWRLNDRSSSVIETFSFLWSDYLLRE
jgi:hypothetical protein